MASDASISLNLFDTTEHYRSKSEVAFAMHSSKSALSCQAVLQAWAGMDVLRSWPAMTAFVSVTAMAMSGVMALPCDALSSCHRHDCSHLIWHVGLPHGLAAKL